MAKQQNARSIADSIIANCADYETHAIDRAAWDAEQKRLWKVAADALIMRDVMRILFPGGAVVSVEPPAAIAEHSCWRHENRDGSWQTECSCGWVSEPAGHRDELGWVCGRFREGGETDISGNWMVGTEGR